MPQHATHIADNRFRRHGTEGNNLGNCFTTVHIGDVFNHLIAFLHAEVDVKVGHRNTFRVQEAFKQQVKFQRIDIGDFQRIGHQRTRTRTTARSDRHAVIFGPLDELHYDQEVAGESHLVDNVEFNFQTLIIFRAFFRALSLVREQEDQTFFQSLTGFHHQIIFSGHIAGRELRQEVLTEPDSHVTTLSNLYAVFQRFRDIREQLAHLLFAAHILLRTVVARALGIVQRIAVVNGNANFVRIEIFCVDKADFIGGDDRDALGNRQFNGGMQIALFVLTTGADQFQIVAIGEMLLVKRQTLRNQGIVATQQAAAHVATSPARQQN